MDPMIQLGLALALGFCIGYLVSSITRRGKDTTAPPVDNDVSQPDWWEIRNQLTGTQLQILQYMEAKQEASITELQEKFSFIPDRELYYRLEQICLMDFLDRGRRDGEVSYVLNPAYSGTIEGDKTVMMPQD